MLLSLVLACQNPEVPVLPSPGVWRLPSEASGLDLIGGSGSGAAGVWVRRVGDDGLTVVGDDVQLEVDGIPQTVAVGADGYGRVSWEGTGAFQLSAEGVAGRAFGYPAHGLRLLEGWTTDEVVVGELVAAGRGVLARIDGNVRWIGREGFAHTVLDTERPALGIRSGHLEDDGVLDAVAWTSEGVFLLRGREDGGMTAVGSIVSTTHSVVAAHLGDPNNDGSTDVVVLWSAPDGRAQLDVWEGDGRLAYRSAPNRFLQEIPAGLAVGSSIDDGPEEVTVLTEPGNWERFYGYQGAYARTGPSLVLSLPTGGAVVLRDFLGDGGDEVLTYDRYQEGMRREHQVVDLMGEVRLVTLDREPSHFSVQDLDANGHDDLLFSADNGSIVWTHLADAPESLTSNTLVADGGPGGAIAATEEGDVLVTGERAWRWYEPELTDDGLGLVDTRFANTSLLPRDGRYGLLHGSGSVKIVGVSSEQPELRIWDELPGAITVAGRFALGQGPVVFRDLAVCGPNAWVLLGDELVHLDLTDPSLPMLVGRSSIAGSKVVCGDGPDSVAAVLADARVQLFAAGAVPGAEQLYPGVEDVALGGGAVAVCATEDCAIERGPFGPGRAVVDVIYTPVETTVDGVPVGQGRPTVADVDGDGLPDLLLHDAGRIEVLRSTSVGFAPGAYFWTRQPLGGALQLGDRDGDGTLEAWAVLPESGRLYVSPVASDAPITPPDTGGSGTGDTAAVRSTADTATAAGPSGTTGDTGH